MKLQTLVQGCALLLAVVGLSACGSNGPQFLNTASLKVFSQNGSHVGQFSATVNSGQTTLVATTFPILNPHNNSQIIGQISLQNNLSGTQTDLVMTLNLDEILGAPSGTNDPTLPNGTLIPISGLNPLTLQTYQVGSTASKVYTNFDTLSKSAMIGAAIAISQFKTNVVGNIFYPFNINNGAVVGTGGLFTGSQNGQSGFAIFVDASSFLASLLPQTDAVAPKTMKFSAQRMSDKDTRKVKNTLNALNKRKATLTVE